MHPNRRFLVAGLFLCYVGCVLGETLTLPDGRVFEEITIIEQRPTKIIVRHTAGLAVIEKGDLPALWKKRFPISADPGLTTKPVHTLPASGKSTPVVARKGAVDSDDQTIHQHKEKERVVAVALAMLPGYFQDHHRPSGGSVQASVNWLTTPQRVPGTTLSQWRMFGEAVLHKYRNLHPRRAEVLLRDTSLAQSDRERLIERETSLGSETVIFELILTPHEGEGSEIQVSFL
jgi:hypothetical protein